MIAEPSLQILNRFGKDSLAILYIGKYDEKIIEFVESVQPPVPREDKWVLILSTLYGCPMKCKMCDAGEYYFGKVSKEGMLSQILYVIEKRYPDRNIPISKLKIQFARMGEPSLNPAVLDLLYDLPSQINAPGLIPCISTVAPNGSESFFNELQKIKNNMYPKGKFQLQFSIHSTNELLRKDLIAPNIWSLTEISDFGKRWYQPGDRKITLNFIVGKDNEINPNKMISIFDPQIYFIKLTPINPTYRAQKNRLESQITRKNIHNFPLEEEFRSLGYDTLLSIGEWEENQIGSNCGQFATKYHKGEVVLKENYTCEKYQLK